MAASAEPPKVFHDPVHGQIELPSLLVKIIDTPQFQRLRSIKQLGAASFVYPGACHTRFEHSIGVAYLAGELAKALRSRQPELGINDKDILCVQIAGLCHDLGHGPFSHLFDQMFLPKTSGHQDTWEHENASQELFDILVKENDVRERMMQLGFEGNDLTFIKEMINPEKDQGNWPFRGRGEEKSFLYEIVANKMNGIDVDKFDYLERDCLHVGLKNTFDYRRFFLFARVCEVNGRKHICLREKEVGNLYDMFYSRYSLHRRVYQHKVTKNVELMITDAFLKADQVLKLSGAIKHMDKYAELTDEVFEKILHSTGDDLKESREILQNIHKRKLYKFVGEAKLKKVNQQEHLAKDQINKSSEETQQITEDKMEAVLGDIIPSNSIEVYSFIFDYGKQDMDPIGKAYFYQKNEPDTGFRILQEQRAHFLPEHFCERIFRVYWKNMQNDDETLNRLKKAKTKFSSWCRDNGFIDSQLLAEDDEDLR